MAASILTFATFICVALSGRMTFACLLFASLGLFCLLYGAIQRKSGGWWRAAIAICFENAALIVGYMTSCGLSQSWAIALPAAYLYTVRVLTGSNTGSLQALTASLPFLMLIGVINDTDLAVAICVGSALAAPIPNTNLPTSKVTWPLVSAALVAFLCSLFAPLGFSTPSIKSAIIRAGEWAETSDGEQFPQNLVQSASYSYSSLKGLLSADSIELSSLSDGYNEAWLITPTRPMSQVERELLVRWVAMGGHLIVISDHTDLFGHGRVLRQVLAEFGISNSLTAFFPEQGGAATAPGGLWDTTNVKTSNVLFSGAALPQTTARWWDEDAEYSSANFFGPLSPSVDDRFGRRVLTCRTFKGKGTVTVHADSTPLANFAIFQPGTPELIQRLRSVGVSHIVWLFVPLVLSVGGSLYRVTGRCEVLAVALSVFVVLLFDGDQQELNWDRFIWVSGDSRLAMETGDPAQRLSTAYSVLGLSNTKPRWTETPINGTTGLIIGDAKVPTGWKHANVLKGKGTSDDGIAALEPLYSIVTSAHPIKPFVPHDNSVSVGGLWTDDVMGDWWFDRGVSQSRRERFQCWVSWVVGAEFAPQTVVSNIWDMNRPTDYWLVLASGDEIKLRLPAIASKTSEKVYLGRGVSAELVEQEGKMVLLGAAAHTEAWGVPYSWVLVPASQ